MTPEERADKLYWELDNIMGGGVSTVDAHIAVIAAAIRAAVAEEREACASLIESIEPDSYDGRDHHHSWEESAEDFRARAAAAIRARGSDIPVEQMPVK